MGHFDCGEEIFPWHSRASRLIRFKVLTPDQIVTLLGASTAPFFRAYEQSGWSVPITGRIDFPIATGAVSPQFLTSGGLDGATPEKRPDRAIEIATRAGVKLKMAAKVRPRRPGLLGRGH